MVTHVTLPSGLGGKSVRWFLTVRLIPEWLKESYNNLKKAVAVYVSTGAKITMFYNGMFERF